MSGAVTGTLQVRASWAGVAGLVGGHRLARLAKQIRINPAGQLSYGKVGTDLLESEPATLMLGATLGS